MLDREGNFLKSWGEDIFNRAHGVHMAPDDTVWLTDDGDSTVRHCTLDGKVLLEIGIPNKPAPYMSGDFQFNRALHAYRIVAERRSVYFRRLWQFPGA